MYKEQQETKEMAENRHKISLIFISGHATTPFAVVSLLLCRFHVTENNDRNKIEMTAMQF